MNDDQLQKLLQSADVDPRAFENARGGMADRVREKHRHQQRRRRQLLTSSAMTAAVVLGVVGWRWSAMDHSDSRDIAAASAAIDEARQLSDEADFHLLVARRMIEAQRSEQAQAELYAARNEPDPADELRFQIDRAAYRLIVRAERLLADMRPNEEAIEYYQQVVQLFPESTYAEVARERLMDL